MRSTGYASGVQQAKAAESQAIADGMPAGRPIYFSIDFDAQPSEAGRHQRLLRRRRVRHRPRPHRAPTAATVSSKRLFDNGKIAWGWQTYAWSYGQWDSRAHLRQIQNGVGRRRDATRTRRSTADFGQWGASAPRRRLRLPPPARPPGSRRRVGLRLHRARAGARRRARATRRATAASRWRCRRTATSCSTATARARCGRRTPQERRLRRRHAGRRQLRPLRQPLEPALGLGNTNGHGGAYLALQDDGNLVVYAPGGHPLWASNTNLPAPPAGALGLRDDPAGPGPHRGQAVRFVRRRATRWRCRPTATSSSTTTGSAPSGPPGPTARADTTPSCRATATSSSTTRRTTRSGPRGTNGHGGAYLAVQTDGNLVVYAPGGNPLWASGTNGK